MDKFYPGQTVRILRCHKWPFLVGSTVRIVKPQSTMTHGFCYETDLILDSIRFCPEESQLEAVYDGNKTVSWEDCSWTPFEH